MSFPKIFKPEKQYKLVRLGKDHDGGYLVGENSIKNSEVLISFGINDDWSIEPSFLYNETTVNIYNRWGKKIFTSVGYQEPFNGKNKRGKLLQQGVYFYSIQLQESANPIRGSLTIY